MENNPIVTIEMEDGGIIKAELYPDIAPQSVYNFISLANSGYYDGLIFHRCIYGFMIQAAPATASRASSSPTDSTTTCGTPAAC